MSIVLQGSTSGSITLQEPAVAGSTVLTLPATTGTVLTSASPSSDLPSSIKGPAFSYYQSTLQNIANATSTKITFTTQEFDTTSGMYASSRFTPTVAGYYQINAAVGFTGYGSVATCYIYKNGTVYKQGQVFGSVANSFSGVDVSSLIYLNGSTDYVEIYVYQGSGGTMTTATNQWSTWFNGAMVRAA